MAGNPPANRDSSLGASSRGAGALPSRGGLGDVPNLHISYIGLGCRKRERREVSATGRGGKRHDEDPGIRHHLGVPRATHVARARQGRVDRLGGRAPEDIPNFRPFDMLEEPTSPCSSCRTWTCASAWRTSQYAALLPPQLELRYGVLPVRRHDPDKDRVRRLRAEVWRPASGPGRIAQRSTGTPDSLRLYVFLREPVESGCTRRRSIRAVPSSRWCARAARIGRRRGASPAAAG